MLGEGGFLDPFIRGSVEPCSSHWVSGRGRATADGGAPLKPEFLRVMCPDPVVPHAPLLGHSAVPQLCPELCQDFGAQMSCLLKASAGETGSTAFACPHFLPRGRQTFRTPGGGRRSPAGGGCLLAPLMVCKVLTAAVQGADTSACVERNQCTTNTAFTASKAPPAVAAHALLSGVRRALSPAWPRSPILWGCAHLRSRSGPPILARMRSMEERLRAPAAPEHQRCSKTPSESTELLGGRDP